MKTRGGRPQTEEIKVKISEAHKGRVLYCTFFIALRRRGLEIKDKIILTSKNRTVSE